VLARLPGVEQLDPAQAQTGMSRQIAAHGGQLAAPRVVVQDADAPDILAPDCYTIVYLHRDLRSSGRLVRAQEENLRRADRIVCSSLSIAAAYAEYDCRIIPLDGADEHIRAWQRLLEDVHLELAARAHYCAGDVQPSSVPQPRLTRYRDARWSRERVRRELRYALPPAVFAGVDRAYTYGVRGANWCLVRADKTLRRTLPQPLYEHARQKWRSLRAVAHV
jgi:hypothetical protein